MSNDLISRSALAKEVKEWLNCDEECCHCEYGDGNCFFKDVIFKQPTAYDVEKVVEQLEECIADTTDTETGAGARWAYKGAIKIVKAGGVSDNH